MIDPVLPPAGAPPKPIAAAPVQPAIPAVAEPAAHSAGILALPPYPNDELVVATPHVKHIKDMLPALGIQVKNENGEEHSARLGLSLLRLEPQSGGQAIIKVDDVLSDLRKAFETKNAGWSPTMGKNRFVDDQVIGGGSMSYGGYDDPSTLSNGVDQAERENWAASRPKGPGARVKIGLVDTRISAKATPLVGAWYGEAEDILSDEPKPDGVTAARWAAVRGHGTFVAGLILSIAPAARLDVRGALWPNGRADSWQAAKAIVDLGPEVDILNLSFTCLTADGKPPLALATAISKVPPSTLIVAAAGNHGSTLKMTLPVTIDGHTFGAQCAHPDHQAAIVHNITECAAFPAALDSVVAVGALDDDGTGRAAYSPQGPWVDVLAPGKAVSTFLTESEFDGFAEWNGTSFAAAAVTGAVAAGTERDVTSAKEAFAKLVDRAGTGVKLVDNLTVVAPTRAWKA